MAQKPDRSLSSLTAIAAASLLLSTTAPALAQSQDSAQPGAAQPTTAPPPAAQPETPTPPQADAPATASPDPAPATTPTMTANPVVQPIPETAPPEAQPTQPPSQTATSRAASRGTQPTPRRPSAATPSAPPAPPPASSATRTSASTLTRHDPAGLYNADGTPAAASPAPAATAQPSPYVRFWPLEAAGAILLAGLIGYAATRRRDEEDEQVETAVADEAPAPADIPATIPATPIAASQPAMHEPVSRAHAPGLSVEEAPSASIMPAGPVPTGEARTALLERMVAAPPDAANPFRTVKARMRRARMILNARQQALRDKATEAFDWRTYQPSLKAYNLTHPTLGTPEEDEPARAPARADTPK